MVQVGGAVVAPLLHLKIENMLCTLRDFNFLGYMKVALKEKRAGKLIEYGETSTLGYIPICMAQLRYLAKFYGRTITQGDEIAAVRVARELRIKN